MALNLWQRIKARLIGLRRAACEAAGLGWYSRFAADDMERKLAPYLSRRGFFVEAGANDGRRFSNTYYLEKVKGWRGVLVEPMPGPAQQCRQCRRRSRVFEAALVSADYPGSTLDLYWADEMSRAADSFQDAGEIEEYRCAVGKWHQVRTVTVPARTLTSILEEAGVGRIDFMSLDVEGFEVSVLRGLDLERFGPRVLLIECRTEAQRDEVTAFLVQHYRMEKQLSQRDYLFLPR